MNKFTSKFAVLGGVLASSACALAQEADSTGITADIVTDYISSGKSEVITVLTAGAAIVGAFFIWGLIKKALNRSK